MFTGVSYFALKHRLWVLVRTISILNEAVLKCTHNLCFEQNKRHITTFHLKMIIFTAFINGCISHRHVVVAYSCLRYRNCYKQNQYPTLKTICQWEIIKYTNTSYTISPDGKLNERFFSKRGRQLYIILTFNNVQKIDRITVVDSNGS